MVCFVGTMMDTGKRAASNNWSNATSIKGWICNLYGYSKDLKMQNIKVVLSLTHIPEVMKNSN